MMIFQIVAMARNRVIGNQNRMPWHFTEDLQHFKRLTMGHTLIMGRKTFDSIGRPLPGRMNIVLSRDPKRVQVERWAGDPICAVGSIGDALKAVKTPKAYIIGGAELYRQTIADVHGLHQTFIDMDYEGDTHFPEIPDHFKEKSRVLLRKNPPIHVIYYQNKRLIDG